MADHADIGPSGLYQVLLCSGSYRMQKGLPNTSSRDARLGTAAHDLARMCLVEERDAKFYLDTRITVEDDVFVVDDDMVEAVQTYVDYCRALPGDEYWVEKRVTVPRIDTWGTADFIKIDRTTRTLFVADYKHGKGVFVSGRENPQLLAYGLGAWHLLSVVEDIDAVEVAVVQPRIDNVTWERYTVEELLAWADRVAPVVREARLNPYTPLIPGEKQCKFCRAKATCPAVQELVQETVRAKFDDLDAGVPSPTDVDFATVLPKLDLIEDWCREVRQAATAHLQAGNEIDGYKLVAGRPGNRRWADEQAAEEVFKSFRFKQEDMYDMKLISPTTAEKRLKDSPRRWARVEGLITREPGKPTIAPALDKRPAITTTASKFLDLV